MGNILAIIIMALCLNACATTSVNVKSSKLISNHRKVTEALGKLTIVINSSTLESKFKDLLFLDEKDNSEIYRRLMTGIEDHSLYPNFTWDFHIRSVVLEPDDLIMGYVYSGGDTIYLNERYLVKMDVDELVGLFCHEYAHLAGYEHALAIRYFELLSVPYQFGYLCEEVSRMIIDA